MVSNALLDLLEAWDRRVAADPLLEPFVWEPSDDRASDVPDGFHLSEDAEHLLRHGGFWPGGYRPALSPGVVREFVDPIGRVIDAPPPKWKLGNVT